MTVFLKRHRSNADPLSTSSISSMNADSMRAQRVLVMLTILGSLSLCPMMPTASALPMPDIDGDSVADLTLITVRRDGALGWKTRYSSTGKVVRLNPFGTSGDIPAIGSWSTAGTSQRVVIRNDGATGLLTWYEEGREQGLQFGTSASTILSGADFDGSGNSDAAIVTPQDGSLVWQVHLNPFTDGGVRGDSFSFGTESDRPFFINVNGDHDWYGIITQAHPPVMILRDPISQEERAVTLRETTYGLTPLPVASESGSDRVAFAKARSIDTMVWFFNLDGTLARRVRTPGTGTAIVGDYLPALAGEEVAITGQRSFNVASASARRSSPIVVRPSAPVGAFTVATFSAAEDEVDDPGLSGCQKLDPYDGSGVGFVWKPNSDTTFYAVAVLPGTLYGRVSTVEVFSGAGDRIKELTYFGCGNPDAAGPRCNHKDFALTGADYRRTYSSIILKVSLTGGTCATFYVADPSRRLD